MNLSGEDLVKLWKLSAPYMGRIVAILKHSEINLQIIHSDDGAKLIEILDQVNIIYFCLFYFKYFWDQNMPVAWLVGTKQLIFFLAGYAEGWG